MNLRALAFSREGKDELRVALGGGFDAGVGGVWDGGTKGARRGGVSKPPYVFYFFGREGEGFLNVDEGGEVFDAGRCGGFFGDGFWDWCWWDFGRWLRWRGRWREG